MGLLVVLAILAVPHAADAQGKNQRDDEPALVRTDKVTLKPRSTTQSFVGSLESVRRSIIGSPAEERVEEVLVEEGDYVEFNESKGKQPVLVELRKQSIEIELEAANIELELRESALKQLEASLPSEVDAAIAEVARLDSELAYAKQVYDRMKGLSSSMSEKELDESFSLFNSARQSLIASNAKLGGLKATRQIRITIATRNVTRQQSEIQRIVDLQSRYTVRTPFSGHVVRKMVEQGNWVTRGTPLVEIIQLDPIELRILVPQQFAGVLQRSFDSATQDQPLTASVEIESLGNPVQAKVIRIIPDVDPVTRSIPVILEIENPPGKKDNSTGHRMKPGMLARAILNIGEGKPVLMVPKDALVLNQGAASIFLLDRNGNNPVVVHTPVETGSARGNWIEVTGQVHENAEVVVYGNERLRNGEAVKVLKEP